MFGSKHYVPILKGKDGEFRALSKLNPNTLVGFTPFIDVPRRDVDPKTGIPKLEVEEYLRRKAEKISKNWRKDRPVFVDVFDIDLELETTNGTYFLEYLYSCLRRCGVQSIPVIGLDRIGERRYVNAIRKILSKDKRGLCIRLLEEDIEMPSTSFSDIFDLLTDLKEPIQNVHLLMDFRSIFNKNIRDVADTAANFLNKVRTPSEWATITLSASGFPENLGCVSCRSVKAIPRVEWDLRTFLMAKKNIIPRFPTFSDYAICHPDLLDYDPRFNPSAAIRYTIDNDWLIVKAGSLKKSGFSQFRQLSENLRKRPEFYGAKFSWGDKFIDKCADNKSGTGNLTTWRQVGTNHHITLVVGQIANSPVI
ncbi:beta family protein [uncultured Desulfosarcina sp.]|uniref:beta family protein n=1 Tax=uncultured Desulfosarcina sp. TaxID=218289 RepID=UPI0029C7E1C7|nr:beta family protein [uncultured Desulfosarcina sp.]